MRAIRGEATSDSVSVIDLRSETPTLELLETPAGRGRPLEVLPDPTPEVDGLDGDLDLRSDVRGDTAVRVGAPFEVESRAEELAPVLTRFRSGYRVKPGRLRRIVDVMAAALVAPLALPLVAAGAVALKLEDSTAPVFYRQHRTGFNGRRFKIIKLRSMVPNADALKAELAEQNLRNGPDFKVVDDPRITAVGRQLRRTSIDELPQLWNVLTGDMTLVGPRPTSLDVDAYEPWQMERFDVMPGLTGLWQVSARESESWDDRIALDIAYARRVRPSLDLWILLKTVEVVVRGTGST